MPAAAKLAAPAQGKNAAPVVNTVDKNYGGTLRFVSLHSRDAYRLAAGNSWRYYGDHAIVPGFIAA